MKETLLDILGGFGHERRNSKGPYSLDRIRAALASLGHPEKTVKTISISGTNGKGTTALYVSSGLVEAGFRVGTYLSPHLQSPTERFLLNLEPISEPVLLALAQRYSGTGHQYDLSYFEFLTLLNFIYARDSEVDFLVLEVGLGGQLDATNVTNPIACGLTNIGYDHCEILGNTKEAILKDKLGIIPFEGLCFTGIEEKNLLKQLETHCESLDAIYYQTKELTLQLKERSWNGQRFLVNGFPFWLNNPTEAALRNASLAFLLLRIVFPKIPVETFQKGFARVFTPGRFEQVQDSPKVLLSGDHNPQGIESLLTTLKAMGNVRPHILCGFSPDKPYKAMLAELDRIAQKRILTQAPSLLSQTEAEYWTLGAHEKDPLQAMEKLVAQAGKDDLIIVTGSLYLVGFLRSQFFSRTAPIHLNNNPSPLSSAIRALTH